jgi:cold shock CspA family protein
LLVVERPLPSNKRGSSVNEEAQTNTDAKADEPEPQLGTVISYNGRYAFVRPDRGGPDIYCGTPQLLKARIDYLKVGERVCFEARPASNNRRPWATRIRLAEPAA